MPVPGSWLRVIRLPGLAKGRVGALSSRERTVPMASLHERPTQQRGPDSALGRGTAEVALLLCLARANLGPEDACRVESILRQPIAWDEFVRLARRHRLLPLCARHLNRLAPARIPTKALQAMREYTEHNVRRSLLLTGELRALLRVYDTAGIPALAYKGPVLAQEVYGSVALRDMLDLDIVVSKQDALRARELLFERGYRSGWPTGERWDASLLWSGSNFPLIQDASGFVVELHWTPEACLPQRVVEQFWERLEHVSLAGMDVATFSRQDLLLLLCMHGCRHMWERLEWLASLAELLRTDHICWEAEVRLATSLGGRRALFLGITLAHDLLAAPVPDDILLQARADSQVARLRDAACQQLFSEHPVLAHRLGLPFHSFQLRSKERLRDRVQYVRQRAVAPSSQAWEERPLPWSLFRLYCTARRLRLLGTYPGWLWRRLASAVRGPGEGGGRR